MALQDTDLLVVNRGGTNYKIAVSEFKAQVGIMGNVIYGTGGFSSGQANITHAAVSLSNSYIIVTSNSAENAIISSRTTTSFLITNGAPGGSYSYFLIY